MKVVILIGLLSFIHVRGADEVTTTTLPAANSTSAATTSAETTENLTFLGTTTEPIPPAEQLILKLIAANTVELNNNQNMLRDIENQIILFSASVTQQMNDIQELGALKLLAKNSVYVMKNNSLYFLKDLTNINYKFGATTGQVTYAMDNLLRNQQESKDSIVQMQNKLKDYQKNILSQSQTIDNSIVQLSKLITRSVLPRLTNLKSRFTGINSSHIILKSELPNIDNTRTIHLKSITKLNELEKQLSDMNIAKKTQIKKISETLQNLAYKNLTDIANTIQNLIIEEKRIDLALSSYNKLNKASLPNDVSVNTKATTKYVTGYVKKSPVNKISEQPKTNFYNHASFPQNNQHNQQKSQAINEEYGEEYEIHQPAFEVYQVPKNIQNQLPNSYDTTTKVSYALPETFKYFANDKLQSPVLPTNNPIKTHYPKERQSKQISGVPQYYGNIKGEDKFVQVQANNRKNIPRKGAKQTAFYNRQKVLYTASDTRNYIKDGKIQSPLNDKPVENYYADELRSEHISESPDFYDHNKDAIKFEQGIKTYQENEDKYEFYNVNKDQKTNKYGNVQT